jgi:hypothetical protein
MIRVSESRTNNLEMISIAESLSLPSWTHTRAQQYRGRVSRGERSSHGEVPHSPASVTVTRLLDPSICIDPRTLPAPSSMQLNYLPNLRSCAVCALTAFQPTEWETIARKIEKRQIWDETRRRCSIHSIRSLTSSNNSISSRATQQIDNDG